MVVIGPELVMVLPEMRVEPSAVETVRSEMPLAYSPDVLIEPELVIVLPVSEAEPDAGSLSR